MLRRGVGLLRKVLGTHRLASLEQRLDQRLAELERQLRYPPLPAGPYARVSLPVE